MGSIGLLIPQKLPFTSSETIKVFRHAISLDERRSKYNIVLWKPTSESLCPDSTRTENNIQGVLEMWFAGVHSGMFDVTPSSIEEVRVSTGLFTTSLNFRRWWKFSKGWRASFTWPYHVSVDDARDRSIGVWHSIRLSRFTRPGNTSRLCTHTV